MSSLRWAEILATYDGAEALQPLRPDPEIQSITVDQNQDPLVLERSSGRVLLSRRAGVSSALPSARAPRHHSAVVSDPERDDLPAGPEGVVNALRSDRDG